MQPLLDNRCLTPKLKDGDYSCEEYDECPCIQYVTVAETHHVPRCKPKSDGPCKGNEKEMCRNRGVCEIRSCPAGKKFEKDTKADDGTGSCEEGKAEGKTK